MRSEGSGGQVNLSERAEIIAAPTYRREYGIQKIRVPRACSEFCSFFDTRYGSNGHNDVQCADYDYCSLSY
jgi:hypothetical protein